MVYIIIIMVWQGRIWLGGGGGGLRGLQPPNDQSHSSTTNVLRYAQALIYIAKSLVVVVVSSKRVVKPLCRQAVLQPEVLHFLRYTVMLNIGIHWYTGIQHFR